MFQYVRIKILLLLLLYQIIIFSLQRYIFDDKYEKQCKMKLKTIQRSGVVDSISNLLRNYNCDSKRLVNLLLKPY